MEKQPTAILLLFTDYLDNRDSIAFLRLSSCVFSSHRSSAGCYRLKQNPYRRFPRPSELPKTYFLPSSHSGHYLCDNWYIGDSDDLAFFFPPEKENSSTAGKSEEIRDKRKKVKSIQLNPELLKDFPDKEKFPDFIENIFFPSRSRYWLEFWALEVFQIILPQGIKSINFGNFTIKEEEKTIDYSKIDFSGFSQLESLKSFDFPLRPGLLPPELKELEYFGDQKIPEGSWPDSLESLSFRSYNLPPSMLPTGPGSYNHPLPSKLPTGLKILALGSDFNQLINQGQLPVGLKKIKLSDRFDQILPIGVFPPGLEEVEFFNSHYSHPFSPSLFPESLKSFNFCFTLKSEYPHPIPPGVLPDQLEELVFFPGLGYSHSLPVLPSGLKSLDLRRFFNLPKDFLTRLPQQLRSIKLSRDFNSPLPPGIFPASLEDIEFGMAYNFPLEIGIFPVGIKNIILGPYFDSHLPVGIFPQGTRAITSGMKYSHPLEVGLFPSSVRKLEISTSHPLPVGVFPDGVESIIFHSGFNQVLLPGIFPSSLRSLKFSAALFGSSTGFTQDILPGVLPEFLCHLDFGEDYSGYLTLSALPPYFVPDSSSAGQSKVFYRMKSSLSDHQEENSDSVNRLIARIGLNREFLVKSLRAPVGFSDDFPCDFFLVSPFDGVGEDFLVAEKFLQPIEERANEKVVN